MYSEIIEHLFGTRVQSAMESGGFFEEGGAENVENWVVYKVRIVVKFPFLKVPSYQIRLAWKWYGLTCLNEYKDDSQMKTPILLFLKGLLLLQKVSIPR